MTQRSDSKPASAPKTGTKANQPTLTELSPQELDNVSGGQKVQMNDIHFVKVIDKSSP